MSSPKAAGESEPQPIVWWTVSVQQTVRVSLEVPLRQ